LQRVLSTAVLLGLLVFTSAAFAITERLKLVKSPVYGTFVSKTVSPTCGCARGKATIAFKLRRPDDVTLQILDARRHAVATLVAGQPEQRGRVAFTWRGLTDEGTRAADGAYQPQIHLGRQHRTILMPNRILLDTKPPEVLSATMSRQTISPDGNHAGDSTKLRYRLSEPAHLLVYLGGRRIVYSHFRKPKDSVFWFGRVAGEPLRAGTYTLEVGAVDAAGNATPRADRKPVVVTVRYIALAPSHLHVRKGARFTVRVVTDARTYRWTFGSRHGTSGKPVLKLTAPRNPGTYALVAEESGRTARATVSVGGA
jgi:hypothetical protein